MSAFYCVFLSHKPPWVIYECYLGYPNFKHSALFRLVNFYSLQPCLAPWTHHSTNTRGACSPLTPMASRMPRQNYALSLAWLLPFSVKDPALPQTIALLFSHVSSNVALLGAGPRGSIQQAALSWGAQASGLEEAGRIPLRRRAFTVVTPLVVSCSFLLIPPHFPQSSRWCGEWHLTFWVVQGDPTWHMTKGGHWLGAWSGHCNQTCQSIAGARTAGKRQGGLAVRRGCGECDAGLTLTLLPVRIALPVQNAYDQR